MILEELSKSYLLKIILQRIDDFSKKLYCLKVGSSAIIFGKIPLKKESLIFNFMIWKILTFYTIFKYR